MEDLTGHSFKHVVEIWKIAKYFFCFDFGCSDFFVVVVVVTVQKSLVQKSSLNTKLRDSFIFSHMNQIFLGTVSDVLLVFFSFLSYPGV